MSGNTKAAQLEERARIKHAINDEFSIDKQTGQGSATEDAYKKGLPENVTYQQTEDVRNYNVNFRLASMEIVGDKVLEIMRGNKSLDVATVHVPMGGKDSIKFTVDRERKMHNPQDASTPIVKQGYITATLETSLDAKDASFKAIRTEIGDAFAAAFKKK